ncbi:MAG: AAA family ATPase [Leptolyngbyaceae cyanobacterium bins.349]|nr:AAA family ATPase [Leptolyngbyaceae cyanobacterium bins.349]
MMTLKGYRVLAQLHESAHSRIYRAFREVDHQPVVLKVLAADYPTPEAIAQFKLEYDLTRQVQTPNTIEAYALEQYQNTLVIVLEDFGGRSLRHHFAGQSMSVADFLPLTIQITAALGEIHQCNILHKDINPSNVLINPQTHQVKIIDFGIASLCSRENPILKTINVLEGTLAYISPEQTGRMNRAIDYRTDFYSLGVTFYELLTGQLPFVSDDPVELVHSHIAKQPVPPHQLNSQVPVALSNIVMKLLEKTAEQRYQSAFGLQIDLQQCLTQWKTTGTIQPFALGQQDQSGKFQIPQKLYGREADVTRLLSAFDRASQGNSEVMLVAGYSGIGKSALVQEIYKPLTRQRGYFINGKFDQFQRNIPYSALIQAFRSLIRQLLAAPEAEIAQWRDRLHQALAPNGQVMVEVIPEMELIIGVQPAVVELSPQEAQNRFNLVLQNFIAVFTQREHPLTIFLDDLQWADGASLQLLQMLTSQTHRQHLLLIGAYRDNEVDASHPLRRTIAQLELADVTIHELTLAPLTLAHIEQLLSDTLNERDRAKLTPFAELILQKTNGNPFFINEFLKSLYSEELLQFDINQRRWHWQLEHIQAAQITDNVVELMAGKIQKLPEATQIALKFAACVGNQFDLKTLAIVREKPLSDMALELWEAIQTGLLLPQSNDYKLLQVRDREVAANLTQINVGYKFLHDRVQQAAYSLIPTEQKQAVHLRIGQLLLQSIAPEKQEEKIFDIVNQLNMGLALIDSPAQRQQLAQLNLIAGSKAKASAAYEPALRYLLVGIDCLDATRWQHSYELTLALHQTAAEAAYLAGNFEQMDHLLNSVLQQGRTTLDQIPAYTVKIQSLIARDDLLAASQQGLQVLKLLGNPLPDHPGQPAILMGLLKTKLALIGKSTLALAQAPEISHPTQLAAIRVLASIASATYLAAPNVFPLTVFKQVELSAKYGNAPESAFAFATYGLILCGVVGDIQGGYSFGELAIQLLERFQAKALQARTLFVVNSFVRHWRDPLHTTIPTLETAFQLGRETGDTEYACFSGLTCGLHGYYSGQALEPLADRMALYAEAMVRFKKQPILTLIQIYQQTVANLRGLSPVPNLLAGDFYDIATLFPQHVEGNYRTAIFYVHANTAVLNYLFGEYKVAIAQIERAIPYQDAVVALFIMGWFAFYDALIRLARIEQVPKSEQPSLWKQVAHQRQQLQKWAKFAPQNYAHKVLLLKAEECRIQGKWLDALSLYDLAIAGAQEHQFVQEAALANELAARCCLAAGRSRLAQIYIQDAHYRYTQWGALAKAQDLESQYPDWLGRKLDKLTSTRARTLATRQSISSRTSGANRSEELDLMTVLKASQTLSEEIQLDKLLSNLMRILIENAGAQRGFLLLETDGKFLIQAQGQVDQIQVLASMAIGNDETLSQAIVNYVIRTKTSVVLNDASREGNFTQDPYILKLQPRSLLCAPLINQGKLVGIVYLENNLTTAAFTSDRLEVLNVLSAQAAISIENARLYTNLATLNQNLTSLNSAYERFVPRQFLQLLNKNSIIDVELGDQIQQEMSVLFTDIRSFTALSEQMTPEENFRFINSYLKRMEPIILQHHGFIDKYIGDAIMALFPRHADDALQTGIDMLKALVEYNQNREQNGYQPIQIGIGINTGSLILGTVGGTNRMDGTVISDAVNLASRIEELTKTFNTPLLITNHTVDRLTNPHQSAMRTVGQIRVKGKTVPVTVYEVFEADPMPVREQKLATLPLFAEALALYEVQHWTAAAQQFQACLTQNPLDQVAQLYRDRCQFAPSAPVVLTDSMNF